MIKLNVGDSQIDDLLDFSIEVETESAVTTVDPAFTNIEQGLMSPEDLDKILDDLEHQIFVIRNEYL